MLVRTAHPSTADPVTMDGAEGVSMQVMVGWKDDAPTFAMRHFIVSGGGYTPHHSHPYEHEVYIVEGELEAECDGVTSIVRAGDTLFVPSEAVHQFRNTGDTQVRFLCMVPVASDCGQPVPGS